MICLTSTRQSLTAALAGTVTARDVQCAVYYRMGTDSRVFNTLANIHDTEEVEILGAPETSNDRPEVDTISIFNRDSATATITIRHVNGSAKIVLREVAIISGDHLEYSDKHGWQVMDSSGQIKGATLSARTGGQATISGTNTSVTIAVSGLTATGRVSVTQRVSTGGFTPFAVEYATDSFVIRVPAQPEIETADGLTFLFDWELQLR